ncbi:MAG TPA: tetratricopeptide repeat protein [Archangium sp.]|nr:tetratricopeptide repeat protein [Archangium sp.]
MQEQKDAVEGPPPALRAGDELGHYLIRTRLAVDPRGEVYLAYDTRAAGLVTLRLLPAGGSDPGAAQPPDEARALAQLRHPHVLAPHEVGVLAGRAFLAQPYVEEPTLQQWLQHKPRGWKEVVRLFVQVGRGLEAAHAAGVVHRDLRPDCVVVGPQGQARLKDFSLAAPAERAARQEPGSEPQPLQLAPGWRGVVGGAPGYMAPEQLRWQPADARADQYSFCACLYEALYGERAFPGERPEQQVLSGEAVVQPRDKGVPRWVQEVVRRGMAYRPAERYASMGALLRHLEGKRARTRWLSAAVAVGLVAAGAWGWVLGPRRACAVSEQEWAGVWDEPRQQTLQQALLATGQPSADKAWHSVQQGLERYTRQWRESRREACEATRVRGEQSEAVLGLKLRCLERRRKEVGALVEVLVGLRGKESVLDAQAVERLTPLEVCADLATLPAQERLPEDPSVRARVEQLQERLLGVKALLMAGLYVQGLEQAKGLTEAAEATGFQPLIADSWLTLTRLQSYRTLQPALIIQSAHRSAQAALASGQLQEVVRAWLELVTAQEQLGKPAAAEQELWLRYLEGLLEAAGNPAPLQADYERRLAFILTMRGRYAEGLAHARKSLALRERLYGPQSHQTASALKELARVAVYAGEPQEALNATLRALDFYKSTVGLEHRSTLRALGDLGRIQGQTGQFAESAATFEQILALMERLSVTEDKDRLVALSNLAATYAEQERYVEANRTLEQVFALVDKMKAGETIHAVIAMGNLAELKYLQGENSEALRVARQALALAEKVTSPQSNAYIAALTTAGEVELQAGNVSKALPLLERAVQLLEAAPEDLREQGRARFALARALQTAGMDRPRSLALQEQARRDFEKAGAVANRYLLVWEAWVKQRRLDGPIR